MNEQKISCPNCKNDIIFNVNALLQGKSFACLVCDSKIQLTGESKDLVSKSMD